MKIKTFAIIGLSLLFSISCTSLRSKKTILEYQLRPVWVNDTLKTQNLGFKKVQRFSPILYENQIIVGNSFDGLISYNKETQRQLWSVPIPYGIESGGLLVGDTLFVGGLNGVMYSVDVDNGQINWAFETSHEIVSEPTLNNGSLFFLNSANTLFSLDASSGKQLWVYNRQETLTQMTVRGGSKPLFNNGLVYVGFSDGSLVAIQSQSGTPQWEIQLNKNLRFKDIDASPVLDNDVLFINSFDDHLYALSKNDGQILWKSNTGGSTTPVISGDLIILGTSDYEVHALNKKSGQLVWSQKLNGISTDPVLFKGHVLVGESMGKLKMFDLLTGQLKDSFEPGRGIMSKISTDKNKNVYFISGEGNFYALKVEKKSPQNIPYLIQ